MSKNGLVTRTGAFMRTSLAFALVGVVAAAGCGDDNNGNIDASVIDARPIDAKLPDAALALSPLTSDFGSVVNGMTSSAMTFTVSNTGGSPSGSISASIMGSGAANFSVETNGCTVLAAAATCTVTVSFSPQGTTAGNRTANLVVSASPGGSVSATLDGTAQTVGSLSINPSTNAFGTVVVGSTSASSATFTVTNPGSTTTGTLTTTAAGSDPGDFQKVTDTCNGQTLAAAATCTLTVNFKPTSAGAKSAQFTVATGTNTVSASVTGTGVSQANVVINPSLQDFGTVTLGSSSGNVTFTVANNGGSPSGTLSQNITGADASSFSVVSGNCAGTTLAPAATCNVILRFTPATVGAKAAQFSITGTPGGTANATLLGTGNSTGLLTITPSPVAFADTTVGQASASQVFTVTNTGGSPTTAIITALAGNDPSQFTIVAGSNGCSGVVLAAGATCTIAVTFTPTSGGAKSANLSASANTGGTATAGISGNGIPGAQFTIAPASHDFGAIGIGTNSSFFSFTVTNNGGQTSAVPTVALGGTNASQFVLQNGCTAALAPAGTCTVQVRFAPNIGGNDTATVTVSGTPGGTATATVTGQAVTPAALVSSKATLNFDVDPASNNSQTLIGDTTTLTYTLTNTGAEPTGPITFTKSGTNQADYTFTSNCTTLPMNMSCTVTVTFTPTASGLKTAALLASASPGGSVSVSFAGNALPRLQITAPATNPFDFGAAIVNTVAPTSVTTSFQNNASTAKTVTTQPLTNVTDFSITSNGCGGLVPAGGHCDVIVQFKPKSTGAKTATLTASVGATAADNTSQVYNGTGVNSLTITGANNPPTVTCSGAACDFGNVAIGTVSGTLTVTVTNPAGAPPASSISTTLSSTEFQIVSDGCASATLGSGGNCQIIVQFQPTGAVGARTGNLTVTASPAGGSTTLVLNGNAVPGANLTFNPTDTLAFGSVFSTETGNQTIVVTNTGGAPSGVLTFNLTGTGPYTVNPAATNPCQSGTTVLAPNASCNLRIQFAPTGTNFGPAATSGVHFSAAGNVGLGTAGHDVAFTGTSVSTISVSSPGNGSFGTVSQNSSTSKVFTVHNASNNAVLVPTAAISPVNTEATITGNNCTVGPLAVNGDCMITVQFAPGSNATPFAGTLTVDATSIGGTPNGTATSPITATVLLTPVISWAPSSFDFGSTLNGAVNGVTKTFTLSNIAGAATSGAVTVALAGSTADYTLSNNGCTGTLAGGASCTVDVKFTPAAGGAAGDKNATLTATVAGGPAVTPAGLKGRSLDPNSLVITPAAQDFGSTIIGQAGATNSFTVQNTSASTLAFTVGTSTTDFTLTGATTCGASLAAGASCTAVVQFNPQVGAAGLRSAQLQIRNPTFGATSAYANLTGTAQTAASLSVAPTTIAFGKVANGGTKTVNVVVTNAANAATSGPITVSALTGPNANQFAVVNTCTTLAGGASCNIRVSFVPTQLALNESAAFTVSATPGLAAPVAVTMTGDGVSNAGLGITPSVGQNAGSRAVGALDPGSTSFTIQNGGDVDTGPLTFSLSPSTDYVILPSSTCVQNGTLGPNSASTSCTINVAFDPQTLGTDMTTLTVSATPGGTAVNTITGTGTNTITVSPANVTFTAVTAGTSMPANTKVFTFTNNSDSATGFLHTVLGGADSTSFSITQDNCAGKTLAKHNAPAGADQCTITVLFTPQTVGVKAATLTVNGAVGTPTATLNGTAN